MEIKDKTNYNKVHKKILEKELMIQELELLKTKVLNKQHEINTIQDELLSFGWYYIEWNELEKLLLRKYKKCTYDHQKEGLKVRVRSDLDDNYNRYFNDAKIRTRGENGEVLFMQVGNYPSDDWIKFGKPLYVKSEDYLGLIGY